jgi:hypothetical protein
LEDASGTSDGIVSVTKTLLAGLALRQAVALALTGLQTVTLTGEPARHPRHHPLWHASKRRIRR